MKVKLYFITLHHHKKRKQNVRENLLELLKRRDAELMHPEIFWAVTPHEVYEDSGKVGVGKVGVGKVGVGKVGVGKVGCLKPMFDSYVSGKLVSKALEMGFPNKVPCAISHVKVWEKMIELDLDYLIVIEDDMLLLPIFFEKIDLVLEGMSSDILFLHIPRRIFKAKSDFVLRNDVLIQSYPGFWGNTGYILSRSGVRKLLDSLPFDDFKDLTIRRLIEEGNLVAEVTTKNFIKNRGCANLSCRGCHLGSTIHQHHRQYHYHKNKKDKK